MNEKTYLIKLYPLETYYFGSHITFGSHPKKRHYFVRSLLFPQQSTLFGMLRYLLLKANGLMDDNGIVTDQVKEIQLIGSNSFDHNSKNANFGCIEKISPVFVHGPDGNYIMQSREFGLNKVTDKFNGITKEIIEPLSFSSAAGKARIGGIKDKIPYLKGLDEKTIWPELLLNLSTGQIRPAIFDSSSGINANRGVFVSHEQIGIDREKKVDKGFYKQQSYSMMPDYCFAFFATLNCEPDNKLANGEIFLPIGGETSFFRAEWEQVVDKGFEETVANPAERLFNKHNSLARKIVLLSDTLIERDSYDDSILLASAETIPFGYIQKIEKGGFQRGSIRYKKSAFSFELLRRGSVLFVKSEDKKRVIDKIIGDNAFHQIGYNHAV